MVVHRAAGARHRSLPAAARRLWLHERVPDLPCLRRRSREPHLRRHQRDHEGDRRPLAVARRADRGQGRRPDGPVIRARGDDMTANGSSVREVALVTGAASGIGRAVAGALVRRGASVALVDRAQDALRAVADELTEDGGRVLAIAADVTQEDLVAGAVDRTVDELGPLCTTVTCAGIAILGSVLDLSLQQWRATLDVNL